MVSARNLIAIGLVAGIFALTKIAVLSGGVAQRNLPQPTANSPVIIVDTSIDVRPGSHTPLLIMVGPPDQVPRDSTLYLDGLPAAIKPSPGDQVSKDLWAVSVNDLLHLSVEVSADASGTSNVTLTLKTADGNSLASARTAISVKTPTTAGVDEAGKTSSPTGSNGLIQLPTPAGSSASEILPPTGTASSAALAQVRGLERSGKHVQRPMDQLALANSDPAERLVGAHGVEEVVAQAARLVNTGDIAGARDMLAAAQGAVTFALAETYDPNMLAAWGTRGISSDVVRARSLYEKALELGIAAARRRLEALE